jgi:hypothetical protein
MSRITERTTTTLQALLVLAVYVTLLLAVPHQWLRPVSAGFAVFAVLVVVGVRAYLRRLEEVARFLASNDTAPPAPFLVAFLTEPERRLLRLNVHGTATEITHVLRRRQAALTSAAMCVAISGICAFLLTLFFYFD